MRSFSSLLAVLMAAAPVAVPTVAIIGVGSAVSACTTPADRSETRQETRVEGRTEERQEARRGYDD